jgi:hypothetical protein
MNRASVGLALLAGLLMMILTVAGVWFVADAAYLALVAHVSPWLAALVTGGLMLLPLLAVIGLLLRSAHRRRLRQQRRLGALKAVLSEAAKDDPYGFVGTAFMSGMMLATSKADKDRIAEFAVILKNMQQGD